MKFRGNASARTRARKVAIKLGTKEVRMTGARAATRTPRCRPAPGSRASEADKVGEIDGLQPGHAKTLALNLKPGHYALICNQPGHYKAGQHTDFTVE